MVGRTLTSSNGSWDNYPTSFARQWRADTVDIPGANDVSYVCLPADLGAMMSVQVTATNSVGSDTATSLEVGPVVDSVGPSPINTVLPVITGTMMVGQTLSVSTGTWDNAPTGYAYEWRRGAVVIAGATAATLVLQPIDEGWRIYCTVTATNANGLDRRADREHPADRRRRLALLHRPAGCDRGSAHWRDPEHG